MIHVEVISVVFSLHHPCMLCWRKLRVLVNCVYNILTRNSIRRSRRTNESNHHGEGHFRRYCADCSDCLLCQGIHSQYDEVKYLPLYHRIAPYMCYIYNKCIESYTNISLSPPLSSGRKPLMGGNWKLNPQTTKDATTLATEVNIVL